MKQLSEEQHKTIIASGNLEGDFVRDNLPDGWEIIITLNNQEVTMDLISPIGNEVQFDVEGGWAAIHSACATANAEEDEI